MRLILLGAPGAGKGTQAELLANALHISSISTGNILREAIRIGTETGLKVKSFMDNGMLVPDELIVDIVRERLAREDCAAGYILDGVPRTIPQAQTLLEQGVAIDRVISIEIPDEVIVPRMTGRRVCAKCGASYHILTNPPKNEGICNGCGGELMIRKDDKPETVHHRLEIFHLETEALKGFYKDLGLLRSVNGNQPIEDVNRDIMAALGECV